MTDVPSPEVTAFFDEPTFTVSYVVKDPMSRSCAIIDSVLDFDNAAGRTSTSAADRMIAFIRDNDLSVEWVLETHAHADHLTAADYLRRKTGAKIACSSGIREVQQTFGRVFNLPGSPQTEASSTACSRKATPWPWAAWISA